MRPHKLLYKFNDHQVFQKPHVHRNVIRLQLYHLDDHNYQQKQEQMTR